MLDKTKKMLYNKQRFRQTEEKHLGQFGEVPKLAEGAPLERE